MKTERAQIAAARRCTVVRAPSSATLSAARRDVARVMLQGAIASFKEQVRRGACEQRIAEARSAMVFWRERLEADLGR